MIDPRKAIETVPPGAWAVGVSGGADSVALLALLRSRGDLQLHVVHLDHETRGGASSADAQFVCDLARRWNLACAFGRRSEIEAGMKQLPTNRSARFRAARMEFFRRIVARENLAGVILAHHLDDQAETIFLRLIRGAGPAGLIGMRPRAVVGGLTILRPLLSTPRASLRELASESREDASNRTLNQRRNVARRILERSPKLTIALRDLADACRDWMRWLGANTPDLPSCFDAAELRKFPQIIAPEAARRWLRQHAGPGVEINRATIKRLLEMANDAASPARRSFPGGIIVRRRGGKIFVDH